MHNRDFNLAFREPITKKPENFTKSLSESTYDIKENIQRGNNISKTDLPFLSPVKPFFGISNNINSFNSTANNIFPISDNIGLNRYKSQETWIEKTHSKHTPYPKINNESESYLPKPLKVSNNPIRYTAQKYPLLSPNQLNTNPTTASKIYNTPNRRNTICHETQLRLASGNSFIKYKKFDLKPEDSKLPIPKNELDFNLNIVVRSDPLKSYKVVIAKGNRVRNLKMCLFEAMNADDLCSDPPKSIDDFSIATKTQILSDEAILIESDEINNRTNLYAYFKIEEVSESFNLDYLPYSDLFSIYPDTNELAKLSTEELERYSGLEISNEHGFIKFLDPMDITYFRPDEIIDINEDGFTLFQKGRKRSNKDELNVNMEVTLFNKYWNDSEFEHYEAYIKNTNMRVKSLINGELVISVPKRKTSVNK